MTAVLHGVAPLTRLGVIRASGEEAAKFLHNQLTQDFALLDDRHARLAAFCSAKGRMLASFIGFRHGADILLVCNADLLAPTLKRLSMFVLRAKVKLSDASAEFRVSGLAGASLAAFASAPVEVWGKTDLGAACVIRLYPADDVERALWVAPANEPQPDGPALDETLWQWGEVRSGVGLLNAANVEAFVPQMLNYESVGGVNFKKGCYPGQEVVARSQYRGTLKRRGYLLHCDAPMAAGQEVFHEADAGQPAGAVAQAAPSPHGGWDAIASLQVGATEGGRLTLGSAQGPHCALQPLPYLLLADV